MPESPTMIGNRVKITGAYLQENIGKTGILRSRAWTGPDPAGHAERYLIGTDDGQALSAKAIELVGVGDEPTISLDELTPLDRRYTALSNARLLFPEEDSIGILTVADWLLGEPPAAVEPDYDVKGDADEEEESDYAGDGSTAEDDRFIWHDTDDSRVKVTAFSGEDWERDVASIYIDGSHTAYLNADAVRGVIAILTTALANAEARPYTGD